ncbi:MAG: alpha/beta fold hydrolase [Bacteroidetes bacterium]|nr:alpha/beta fold hydrolase [Bacteroidota bacterium]
MGKEFSQFNTLFFEFSGHGKTPDVDRNWSIQEFSEQLLSFCKKHNTPLLVFGYSMGGYIALHLALRHPEQFKGIITFGTKLDWSPEVASKRDFKTGS